MQKNKLSNIEDIQSLLEYYVSWSDIHNVTYDFRKYTLTLDLLRKEADNSPLSTYHMIKFLGVAALHIQEQYEEFDYKEALYLNDLSYSKDCKYKVQVSLENRSKSENQDLSTSICNVYIEIGECLIYLKAHTLQINTDLYVLE